MRTLLVATLVLATALAGCSAPDAPEAAPAPERAAPEAAPVETLLPASAYEGPGRAALAVGVSLDLAWLRPFEPLRAAADAPAGADVLWFVSHEEEDARVTVFNGVPHASRWSTPMGHHHPPGTPSHRHEAPPSGRTRADLGELPPGGRGAITFEAPGRYELATAEGARVNVTVRDDAPVGRPAQTFALADAASGAPRFAPDELDVPTGARVLFWNEAGRAVDLREARYLAPLPARGPDVALSVVDEGVWRVHALARDGADGFGAASRALLVDYERPPRLAGVGPWTGSFLAAGAGAADGGSERTFRFNATFPVETLELRLRARADAPAPEAVVRVEVRDPQGALVAEASSADAAPLALADLPAGRYAFVVTCDGGALVEFTLAGEARYRLPEPEALRGRDG